MERKETRELIKGYIDLLEEHLNIHENVRNAINKESLR
jgi:hypothetical protein